VAGPGDAEATEETPVLGGDTQADLATTLRTVQSAGLGRLNAKPGQRAVAVGGRDAA
jgi:hypothetical protein